MSLSSIMMASTLQHRQQHQQQQRYHTLGGQSQQSGSGIVMHHHHPSGAQPSTLQRRMLANVRHHQRPAEQQSDAPTPICRCRVLYLGSAVPQVTKDGLQGIQEPLRELYPEGGAMGARGIDSWLSVWSNGLLLENVDENHKRVTRFFPIDSLHYCAAVRYVLVPSTSPSSSSGSLSGGETGRLARFLPLDSPFARHPNIHHPPLFACIMRRTTGIKVLECHVFICKRETAANALVRCCFHAYADSTYAQHLEEEEEQQQSANNSRTTANGSTSPASPALNSIEKVETWKLYQQTTNGGQQGVGQQQQQQQAEKEGSTSSSHGMGSASVSMLILDHGSADEDTGSSIITAAADQNHKIWLPPTNTNSKGSKATSPRRLAPTGPVAPVADMYGGGGVVGPPHLNTLRSVRSNVSVLPSRSSRPRQIPAPSAAPPPPPPVLYTINLDESDGKVMSNKKSSVSSRRGGGSELGNNDDIMSVMTGPVSISGGRRMIGPGGGGGSIINFPMGGNGGMAGFHPHPHPPPFGPYGPGPFFRPGPGGGPPPGAYLVPMPVPIAPGGKKSKGGLKFGTFSARGAGKKSSKKASKNGGPPPGMMMMPPHHPLALAPPPMALGLPVPMMAPPLSMRRPSLSTTGGGGPSAEEPIYMPSHVRPLSPIASYAPAHFPHEAYLMHQQHYAAGPYVQQQPGIVTTTLTRPNGKKSANSKADKKASKKKQKGQQQQLTITGLPDDMDDVDDVDLDEDDAEHVSMSSGAGIYRKGHLNERAFSYSIRQEHRSRSYSSLVAAGTGPSPSGGGYGGMGDDLRAHDKKERELIQMVHDLDLSVDDDLERSQVPLAMYPPHHRRP